MTVTGGHELPHAHGARVGALQAGEWPLLLPGKQHQLGELLGEELLARGVVEPQGVEAVEHGMATHLATVEGLYADDGDDEGSGHPVVLLGPGQGGGVALPEADPVPDPLRGDE
ncbi:hypothetical protein D3C79_834190 [compost metagenome]